MRTWTRKAARAGGQCPPPSSALEEMAAWKVLRPLFRQQQASAVQAQRGHGGPRQGPRGAGPAAP